MFNRSVKHSRRYISELAVLLTLSVAFSGCSGSKENTSSSSEVASETTRDNTSASEKNSSSESVSSGSSASDSRSDSGSSSSVTSDSASEAASDEEEFVPVEDEKTLEDRIREATENASAPSISETEGAIVMDADDLNEPEIKAEGSSDKESPESKDRLPNSFVVADDGEPMQVVFFGDSQLDNFRTEDGIAYLVSKYCNASVYNCAIGGTCAALETSTTDTSYANWTSNCFPGMVFAASGLVNPRFLEGLNCYNPFKSCDFSKTDIFVVEYGANDFFTGASLDGRNGLHSYPGALTIGINALKDHFPNAKIIVCGPTYAQFFQDGKYIGDSNILFNGEGTLYDYVCSADNTSMVNGCYFFNPYKLLGFGPATEEDTTVDGIHMNDYARRIYSQYLARIILRQMGYNVPEGLDLTVADNWSQVTKSNN